MLAGYKYHMFISYRRGGEVQEWVRNHFFPVLRNRVESLLGEDPRIFIDEQIEVGTKWPDVLADALHRSCCLVPVWSPRYFYSDWCMEEWKTMLAREQKFGIGPGAAATRLIYPVVFWGGKNFPEEAKRTQYRMDLHDYAYPYEQFKYTKKYLAFHDKMTEVAQDLIELFGRVPPLLPASDREEPFPKPAQHLEFERL